MYDISKLSSDELSVYEANYLVRKTLLDIESFYCELEKDDVVQLASALHNLVLQFDPGCFTV